MATVILTASNLAVAATETLPLMDVNDNFHIPSTTPFVPPPSLPSGSSSAGKRTHSVMSLDSEGLHSASTEITTPSTNADPMLEKQAKTSDQTQKSCSSRHKSSAYGHAPASSKVTQASAMVSKLDI
jgi:hypothetical protein